MTKITGLELAQKFHEVYEELALDFGYETQVETKIFDTKSLNGRLMIATCERIIEYLTVNAKSELENLEKRVDFLATVVNEYTLMFNSEPLEQPQIQGN